MSTSKAGLTGTGRMSSAHGTTGQSKNNNMNRNNSDAIGKGCRTFRSGIPGEAGYKGGGTAQAKQPKGHG